MKCYIRNETKDTSLKEYYPLIRSYFKKAFKVLDMQGNYEIDPNTLNENEPEENNKNKIDKKITLFILIIQIFNYFFLSSKIFINS